MPVKPTRKTLLGPSISEPCAAARAVGRPEQPVRAQARNAEHREQQGRNPHVSRQLSDRRVQDRRKEKREHLWRSQRWSDEPFEGQPLAPHHKVSRLDERKRLDGREQDAEREHGGSGAYWPPPS